MENQKSAPVYQVVEKFVSINGEGRRAGELAVFIRMKGCNLHCSYCDTYWANESDCESTETVSSTNLTLPTSGLGEIYAGGAT